eukprot:scaffold411994_cov13-Prasinocladus_malaysianus.AAC.1
MKSTYDHRPCRNNVFVVLVADGTHGSRRAVGAVYSEHRSRRRIGRSLARQLTMTPVVGRYKDAHHRFSVFSEITMATRLYGRCRHACR